MAFDVNIVRSSEAAARAGVTYRQLHHWLSLGYVRASGVTERADWAAFTESDVAVATALGRCGKAGWSTQHVAGCLDGVRIGAGPGWLVVTRDLSSPADVAYTAQWCAADDLASVVADDPGPHVLTSTDVALAQPVRRTRRRAG